MAGLRPAAEMKDSGIEWVGKIPSDKKVVRNKYYFHLTKGKIPSSQNSEGKGVPYIGASELDSNCCRNYTEDDTVPVCNKDDVLILWDGARAGLVGTGKNGAISSTVVKCVFANNVYPSFGYWYFKGFEHYFAEQVHGTTIPHMNTRYIEDIGFINWSIKEQQAIAAYLDERCAKIDELIAEAAASIAEYKQLKQAVIFEAVTQGLDKNVPIRNTGNIWFPVLPMDVALSRVSRHYTIILGKMLCPNKRDDDDTIEPYYCAANVHFDGISGELKEMWFNTAEKRNYIVHKNDMLIVEGGAGAGGAAIVVEEPEQPTFVQNSIMIVRSKDSKDNRYLCYVVQALVKNKYVDFVCNKATIPHFTKEKVSGIPYPAWSKDKRIAIADYLDKRVGEIDSLISEKQALIDDLQAYKKSLIYEAVTGKRRVV